MDHLTLRVRDLAGLKTVRPVTGGVPLAASAAPKGSIFHLHDDQGRPAPLQTQVLARWADGSARWVLLDFQAAPTAGQEGAFTLTWNQTAAASPAQPVLADDHHRLYSGDLALQPGDQNLLTIADRFDLHLTLTDDQGQLCQAISETLETETAGPLRATVQLHGAFRDQQGRRRFQFRLRASLYAGLPLVRLEPGILIDADQGLVQRFRSLELTVRPRATTTGVHLGGDPGWSGSGSARLFQGDDLAYCLEGAASGQGKQAPGWALLDTEQESIGLALRDFWQQWPKSLEADEQGLSVGLFPAFSAGAYAHLEPWHKYQYLFEGDCYRMRAGQARRWQVWLDLSGQGAALAQHANAPLTPAADPIQAIATGVWDDIAPAGDPAMQDYDPWAANLFAAYCRSIEAQRDYGELNWGDWYGERKVNWGNHEYDTTNQILIQFARTGDPRYLYWGDMAARHSAEVDTVHHVNDELEAYYQPWVKPGYPPRPGLVHQHAVGHVGGYYSPEEVARIFAQYGSGSYTCLDPFNLGHIWTQGLARHYFLTGDPFVRQTVEAIGDNLVRLVEDGQFDFARTDPHYGRVAGWTLLALAGAYELDFDDRFLRAMKALVDDALTLQDPNCGGWIYPLYPGHCHCERAKHVGMAGFITAVLINGLSRYYLLTGDQRLPAAIARAVTFLDNDTWREERCDWRYTSCPATGPTSQPGVTIMAHVNAVRIADQPEHLRVLRLAWQTKFRRLLAAPQPGPGLGKVYSATMLGCPEAAGLLAKREKVEA